ncbi:GDSL esterase/lipase, partial [Dichanthelium oligosanthes]
RAQFSPPEYVAFLVGHAGAAVREAYQLGGRKIQLTGIMPVGCVPIMRTLNLQKPGECMEEFNQFAVMFKAELHKAADKLTGELPGAPVVYSDMYGSVSAAIANPLEAAILGSKTKMPSQHLQYYQWLLLLLLRHFLLSPSSTAAAGKVSAIIVFGDSTVDPGNNYYNPFVGRASFPPYGRDFNGGVPTGRYSNGRLIPDFISEGFGLPSTVPAYFDTNNTIERLAMGVSFASSGAGLDDLTSEFIMAIPLSKQIENFMEYKERLTLAKGQSAANEIIAEALYYFGIGNNDIGVNYFLLPQRRAQFSPSEYVAYLNGHADAAVREVYQLGGRKIQLTGILPVGCVPAMRTVNLQMPGECREDFNQYATMFNAELRKVANKLNGELPGAQLVYEDYSLVSAIIANPLEYGK